MRKLHSTRVWAWATEYMQVSMLVNTLIIGTCIGSVTHRRTLVHSEVHKSSQTSEEGSGTFVQKQCFTKARYTGNEFHYDCRAKVIGRWRR